MKHCIELAVVRHALMPCRQRLRWFATHVPLAHAAVASETAGLRCVSSVAHKPVVSIEFPGVEQPRADDTLCVSVVRLPQPTSPTSPFPSHLLRVDIVFVNYAGNRTRVPAKVGESILTAALKAKYTFVDGALCDLGMRTVSVSVATPAVPEQEPVVAAAGHLSTCTRKAAGGCMLAAAGVGCSFRNCSPSRPADVAGTSLSTARARTAQTVTSSSRERTRRCCPRRGRTRLRVSASTPSPKT